MLPNAKRWSRRSGAFTLAELLVAAAASVFLASIIYTAGSEMLLAFARNISINRSYSDARLALERIAQTIESAGHTPVPLNGDGLTLLSPTTDPRTGLPVPAPGIRFYRLDPAPSNTAMVVQSGLSTGTSLLIKIPTGGSVPQVGDLMSIPLLGFQNLVTAVSGAAPMVTLSFGGSTIASGCKPALSTSYVFVPTQPVAITPTPVPQPIYCACLQFTQVEFLVVGTQLRYYPRAPTTSAAVSAASNYKVITNLVAATQSNPNSLLPFSVGPVPTIGITLCAQGPDYNNVSNIHAANVYTQMQTCLGPRNPLLLQGPF